MKKQQYFAGVLLIALLVGGAILFIGERIAALMTPQPEVSVQTGQLPSAGNFLIDLPVVGEVKLLWSAPGGMFDDFVPPTEEELAAGPDLGKLELSLLLQKQGVSGAAGYVDLETTLVFTGYHTIDTTIDGATTTLTVGPYVDGSYADGTLGLMSETFSYVTNLGEPVERQFWLSGGPSDTPGVLVGEYRETVWGFGTGPITIFGTFELKDLMITLAATDDAPVVDSMSLLTNQETAVAATLIAADLEGAPLTYTIMTQPAHGALSGTAPNLTYTPNASFKGTDTFTFKVNDGGLESEEATVTITVVDPNGNDTPTASAQTVNATTAQAKSITLTGADADSDPLTFVVVTQPTNGTLSGSAPNLSYTSNGGFVGTDSFTFKVNDGTVDSTTATVTINVTAATGGNNAPTANAQTLNVTTALAKSITLTGADADSDPLTFTVVTQPTNGTLSGSAPNLSYTSNGGFVGTDSFTFKVNDGTVDSATATVTLNVTAAPANNTPTANAQTVNAATAQAKSLTLTGSDSDSDPLTFVLVTQPINGTLSGTAPNLSYTSNGGFVGTDSFTFKVNDGTVDSATATVTLNVTAVAANNAPTATGQTVNAATAQAKSITLTGFDPDNDPLTFIVVTQPVNGTQSGSAPNLSYTSNGGFVGIDTFTFKVNDGKTDSPTATVILNVTSVAVNNAPTANSQTISAVTAQAKSLTLTGTDPDSDPLTFVLVTQPINGSLSGTAPNLSYTSNGGFVGTDTFTFKVNDGKVDSTTVAVIINVAAPTGGNTAPTADGGATVTEEGKDVTITLGGSDPENNTLTFIIVNQPTNGTLTGTAPNLTYTPNPGFVGIDSFTYKVSDGSMESATVTVTIDVKAEGTVDEEDKIFLPMTEK